MTWLSGWNYDDHPKDETIVEALKDRTLMDTLLEYFPDPNDPTLDHCFFGKGRRVERLNVTDVLLFDYQVKHRGGTNRSPDLRSLLYLTYARKWYKDTNFAPRASSAGQDKRAKFQTSKAHISAVFHSFRLIFGRAIVSRDGLEAWMLFPERARAEHSR